LLDYFVERLIRLVYVQVFLTKFGMEIRRRKVCCIMLTIGLLAVLLLDLYQLPAATDPLKDITKSIRNLFDNVTSGYAVLSSYSSKVSRSSVSAPRVVLPSSVVFGNETFRCKTAAIMNMAFPVCLYEAQSDNVVSAWLLQRGQYFEAEEVSRFLRLLHLDRRIQFVDIGANLGLWSLPAARMTQVLAVEPNWRSLFRLAKAVQLGAIDANITLVQNAVSNVRTTLSMGVQVDNQGHAFLEGLNTTECNGVHCMSLSEKANTVFLNDLLPLMRSNVALMKVDTEGQEANIFTDLSAGQFFDHINVPVVFMEWLYYQKYPKQYPKHIVERLLNFFYSRNYTAFDPNNSKLNTHYRSWPMNVVFKKSPYYRL